MARPEASLDSGRLPASTIISGIAGVLGIAAIVSFSLFIEYQEARKHAEAEAENLTRVLEQHAIAVIQKADLLLQEVQGDVLPDDMHRVRETNNQRTRALHETLKSRQDTLGLGSIPIHIINRDGELIHSSVSPMPKINIADREHFRRHKQEENAGLVISHPVISRTTGQNTLILLRRINFPDGSFAGTADAVLDMEQFQKLYLSLKLGAQGSVTMFDAGSHIAARYPPADKNFLGKPVPGDPIAPMIAAGMRQGIVHADSPLDGVRRLQSWRQVGNFPIFVSAGLADVDFLAEWRSHRWQQALAASIFASLLVWFGLRQARDKQAIQASNLSLKSALDDLRSAQGQLVQAEKMATLGQLVTNVAHEINTPITAIKSSGDGIASALNETLDNLRHMFEILDPQSRELFTRLIGQSRGPTASLTSREERAIKNGVTEKLIEAGVPDAEAKAQAFVVLHAYSEPLTYLPLLKHPESGVIFETALCIGTIINGTRNIHAAVERVSKIVTTLKSFSSSEGTGERIEADLKQGIEAVLTIYSNQIKQSAELVRNYEDVPLVLCRPGELKQVWTHLIHNALQAMPEKGVLTIHLRQEGGEVVVSISDTGTGIPESIRARIFEPFFTTRSAGEGAGLGLDVANKIVERHKGTIDVQTEVGIGSTFSVRLPLTAIAD